MNNMGMRNAALEQRALDLAHEKMQQRNVPVKMIPHDPRMLEEENRKQVLLEM